MLHYYTSEMDCFFTELCVSDSDASSTRLYRISYRDCFFNRLSVVVAMLCIKREGNLHAYMGF